MRVSFLQAILIAGALQCGFASANAPSHKELVRLFRRQVGPHNSTTTGTGTGSSMNYQTDSYKSPTSREKYPGYDNNDSNNNINNRTGSGTPSSPKGSGSKSVTIPPNNTTANSTTSSSTTPPPSAAITPVPLPSNTPAVGSASGNSLPYPPALAPPQEKDIPQPWKDRYNDVKAKGLIPDIPPAILDASSGVAAYPPGTDPLKACSWTQTQCHHDDIWQSPPGLVALGIDDGPTREGTPALVDVLQKGNFSATHFLIGSSVLGAMDAMMLLNATVPRQNFASHTWSHKLLTTLTDMQVIGELGWASQIIYDVTGTVPMYLRPPQGDVDDRVRAIAKYVFGLQVVMWTKDADDWCLQQGSGSQKNISVCAQGAPDYATVEKVQVAWAQDSAGWISLTHELADQQAKALQATVAAVQKNSALKLVGPVPELQKLPWAQNLLEASDVANPVDSILPVTDAINITDQRAPPGSPGAPDVAAWVKKSVLAGHASEKSKRGDTQKTGAAASTASVPATSTLLALTLLVLAASSAVLFPL